MTEEGRRRGGVNAAKVAPRDKYGRFLKPNVLKQLQAERDALIARAGAGDAAAQAELEAIEAEEAARAAAKAADRPARPRKPRPPKPKPDGGGGSAIGGKGGGAGGKRAAGAKRKRSAPPQVAAAAVGGDADDYAYYDGYAREDDFDAYGDGGGGAGDGLPPGFHLFDDSGGYLGYVATEDDDDYIHEHSAEQGGVAAGERAGVDFTATYAGEVPVAGATVLGAASTSGYGAAAAAHHYGAELEAGDGHQPVQQPRRRALPPPPPVMGTLTIVAAARAAATAGAGGIGSAVLGCDCLGETFP